MLEIKPNCECCDGDLPPLSTAAMICSYECTFCQSCVDDVLKNVCPNCGGGFQHRPIRPQVARRDGVGLEFQPASTVRVQAKHEVPAMAVFAAAHAHIPHDER